MRRKFFFVASEKRKDIQPFAPRLEQHRKWPFGVWSRLGHAEILSSPSIAFPPEKKLFYVVQKTPWHKRPKSAFFLNMKIHDFRKPRHAAAKRSFGVDKNCCLSLWNGSLKEFLNKLCCKNGTFFAQHAFFQKKLSFNLGKREYHNIRKDLIERKRPLAYLDP